MRDVPFEPVPPAPAGIEHALMLGLAQIVDGVTVCSAGGCIREACLTSWNGADPEPAPYCLEHALTFVDLTRRMAVQLFG